MGPRDRVGQRVRFSYTSRVGGGRLDFEGEVVRWRKDRGGKVGWFDVRCGDGIERSCRPTVAETIE